MKVHVAVAMAADLVSGRGDLGDEAGVGFGHIPHDKERRLGLSLPEPVEVETDHVGNSLAVLAAVGHGKPDVLEVDAEEIKRIHAAGPFAQCQSGKRARSAPEKSGRTRRVATSRI